MSARISTRSGSGRAAARQEGLGRAATTFTYEETSRTISRESDGTRLDPQRVSYCSEVQVVTRARSTDTRDAPGET
ncbi:unnamed protein product [Ectocarpus sp. CCAP 1310/34]|nr:unnamed protein product [Ectocarpus sp. CCAP 1310/34]